MKLSEELRIMQRLPVALKAADELDRLEKLVGLCYEAMRELEACALLKTGISETAKQKCEQIKKLEG